MNPFINLIVGRIVAALAPLLAKALAELGQQLVEKIAALLPVIVAAGTKASIEQIARKLPGLPALDLPNLPQLAENIRADASAVLPADVDIPLLSDFGEKVFGFDLTDLITGKKHS